MTKVKLKSIVFNSDIVYKQNCVPFIFLVYFLIIREIIPIDFLSNKCLRVILYAIPMNIIWIYPAISAVWCIANYFYKKRRNTINKIDSKSLIIAICLLAFDSYFMFALYLIADLSI